MIDNSGHRLTLVECSFRYCTGLYSIKHMIARHLIFLLQNVLLENYGATHPIFFYECVGSKLQGDSQNWSQSNMAGIKSNICYINWNIMN